MTYGDSALTHGVGLVGHAQVVARVRVNHRPAGQDTSGQSSVLCHPRVDLWSLPQTVEARVFVSVGGVGGCGGEEAAL